MLILAVDTSTEQAGLGLVEDRAPRAEWTWTAAGNHSQHLHRLLTLLFETEGIGAQDLHAVVVATGPGSFSGLRVGVSFCKGLALALEIPLAGVSTLDAIAFAGIQLGPAVVATIPAGREQLYVGQYAGSEARFVRTGDYAIMRPDQAADLVTAETVLCGSGTAALAAELGQQGRRFRRESAIWSLRRPSFLAELGRRAMAEGTGDGVHEVEPLYIRRSAAEEKRSAGGK